MILARKEKEWEGKIYEQKIQFLEDTISNLKKTIKDLETEAARSVDQVAKIAEKAIEGASGFKAFSSVKEIALEQARKTGATESDKG
jgi:t-SNARE complex subunit (syntaxin)